METNEDKVILFHGLTNEEMSIAMRALKTSLKNPEKFAFATTTETSLGWNVSYLVQHIAEEHREMSVKPKPG